MHAVLNERESGSLKTGILVEGRRCISSERRLKKERDGKISFKNCIFTRLTHCTINMAHIHIQFNKGLFESENILNISNERIRSHRELVCFYNNN